jgi:hypothetical protein
VASTTAPSSEPDDSPGFLEARLRLVGAYSPSCQVRDWYPARHPRVLRLIDIAEYIGVEPWDLLALRGTWGLSPGLRWKLATFFAAWDAGLLEQSWRGHIRRKRRDATLAKVVATARQASQKAPAPVSGLNLRIDLTTLGPRLRMR